jgi:hypothetical protein
MSHGGPARPVVPANVAGRWQTPAPVLCVAPHRRVCGGLGSDPTRRLTQATPLHLRQHITVTKGGDNGLRSFARGKGCHCHAALDLHRHSLSSGTGEHTSTRRHPERGTLLAGITSAVSARRVLLYRWER